MKNLKKVGSSSSEARSFLLRGIMRERLVRVRSSWPHLTPDPQRMRPFLIWGLIYAHSRNPQRDIEKSLEYFKRLIKNYPKSPFVDQAKIWVGILEENEELSYLIRKLKQVDIDIEEMKRNRPQ